MIKIDTHTHFYDPGRPEGIPWPPADDKLLYRPVLPEHFKMVSEAYGIDGTIVVEASDWLEDNQWVLDLAQKDPFILGVVGQLIPGESEFAAQLERFAKNPLFRGIRCRDSCFRKAPTVEFLADMQLLDAKDLSLDVLVYRDLLDNLLHVAKSIPNLRIVIDHIGHMPIDGKPLSTSWLEYYGRLASQPEIFMKVSALPELSSTRPAPVTAEYYYPILEVLWDAFGSERLIFGSNWPVCERASDYSLVNHIVQKFFSEKGDNALENFFWRNAKRVYKWGSDREPSR